MAADRAASKLIGAVARPVGSDAVTGQFGRFLINLAPGQSLPIAIFGDFLYIEKITGNGGAAVGTVDFSQFLLLPINGAPWLTATDNNTATVAIDEIGRSFVFPRPFDTLFFTNAHPTFTVQIACYVGAGRLTLEGRIQQVANPTTNVEGRITRPANANPYAANQSVSDAAGSVFRFLGINRQLGGSGVITKATLMLRGTAAIANADFSMFLYSVTPTPIADQAAFPMLSIDLSGLFVGMIRFPTFITGGAGSDSAICVLDGIRVPYKTAANSSSLFGRLMANAAYVPSASEIIDCDLCCVWD